MDLLKVQDGPPADRYKCSYFTNKNGVMNGQLGLQTLEVEL